MYGSGAATGGVAMAGGATLAATGAGRTGLLAVAAAVLVLTGLLMIRSSRRRRPQR